MKTNSENSIWGTIKTTFFVFQILIIALAIPVLSYLEMSYDTKTVQEQAAVKNRIVPVKQNATVFTQ